MRGGFSAAASMSVNPMQGPMISPCTLPEPDDSRVVGRIQLQKRGNYLASMPDFVLFGGGYKKLIVVATTNLS